MQNFCVACNAFALPGSESAAAAQTFRCGSHRDTRKRTTVLIGEPAMPSEQRPTRKIKPRACTHHGWAEKISRRIGFARQHKMFIATLLFIAFNSYHRHMTIDYRDGPPLEISALFRSLSDPNRLAIVKHLLLSPHRVADLVGHLGLAQSTVSAHIRGLRDSGLLSARVRGRATFYSLAEPELTAELLSAAAELFTATEEVDVTCPPDGSEP